MEYRSLRGSKGRRSRRTRSEERRVGKEGKCVWGPVQAEDGIRDLTVTGVQTCALPISSTGAPWTRGASDPGARTPLACLVAAEEQVRPPGLVAFVGEVRREHGVQVAARLEGQAEQANQIGRASCRERG